MPTVRSLLTFLVLAVFAAGCDSTGTGQDLPDEDGFDRAEMLDHLGSDVVLPAYTGLQAAVDAFSTAAEAFAEAPSFERLDAARSTLKTARLAWQFANLYAFGPAESATLRAALNTFPVDESQIEDNVASGEYVLGTIENRAAAGLPALGYLLHGAGDTDEDIVTRYTGGEHAANRAAYLLDVTAAVKTSVDDVAEAWSPSGGNYVDTFASPANTGTDVGSSLGMLVNALVLHYERFLRDGKIGIPAGVRSAGVPRPTSTEAYHAGYSLELALANLEAARALFLGHGPNAAQGMGLDDHLVALDADALSAEIVTEMDEAIAALEALEDPLSIQIETNNEPVLTAFTELQDVVVLLKADMTSVLGITITFQDNDGD